MPGDKEYLSDGAYAEFDGFQIRLSTDRAGIEHEIFLDPRTLTAFFEFVERELGLKFMVENNVIRMDSRRS